jgi:hypothetical protein
MAAQRPGGAIRWGAWSRWRARSWLAGAAQRVKDARVRAAQRVHPKTPRVSAGLWNTTPRRAVQRHDPESDFLFRAMSTAYSSGASPFLLGGSVSPVASGSSRGVPVAARWQIILRRVEQRGADICDVDHPDQACFADHR